MKICKQCLQTTSAFGDFVLRPLTGASPLETTGDPSFLGYSPEMKIPGAATALKHDKVTMMMMMMIIIIMITTTKRGPSNELIEH